MSNAASNAPSIPQGNAEESRGEQSRALRAEPHLTSEENVALSDAHVRGPQRMTRVEAIAAVRARLAAVNAERKAKP